MGTTLDFSGGLNGKGFVFNNPNADRTCGCGESFSFIILHVLHRKELKELEGKSYEFGFVTDISSSVGLNEEIIKLISSKKMNQIGY